MTVPPRRNPTTRTWTGILTTSQSLYPTGTYDTLTQSPAHTPLPSPTRILLAVWSLGFHRVLGLHVICLRRSKPSEPSDKPGFHDAHFRIRFAISNHLGNRLQRQSSGVAYLRQQFARLTSSRALGVEAITLSY